jgi:hypothetical protein
MKKFLSGFMALIMLLLFTPVTQAQAADFNFGQNKNSTSVVATTPVIYSSTFTVTQKGGNFKVGFVKVGFKSNFMSESLLPIQFTASIYAENGQVYIEFTPDTPNFYKKVNIKVSEYKGYLYDKALGKNIYVKVKADNFTVEHFCRYALCR